MRTSTSVFPITHHSSFQPKFVSTLPTSKTYHIPPSTSYNPRALVPSQSTWARHFDMSIMRHLLEFRHREFAKFLRSRGTLPPNTTARPRPRPRPDHPPHPSHSAPTRSSALPLPPLPALPTLTHHPTPSPPSVSYPTPTEYRTPPTLPHADTPPFVTHLVTPTAPVPSSASTHVDHPKTGLSVKAEAVVKPAHITSFAKTTVGSARKRPRHVAELVNPSVKRRKDTNATYSNITSPTGVTASVVTPGKGSGSEYDQARSGKETAPTGVGTRSSSEQTEDVDESAITPGFECQLCNARFYRKHHLERHIQNIHEGQRPWICEQCGFAFHQKPNLERHIMTVHQEQKPFRCNVCKMSFGRKGVLKKHVQMVHEHSRKFECEICNIPFGLKSDRKRHVQSVHQKKRPFVCDVCSASFGRRSDLKRHTLSLHPGVEVPTRKNSGPSKQDIS